MATAAILMIFASIFGALLTAGTTMAGARDNKQSIEQTNQANLDAVRETNAANVEQANLAYQRSLPAQQLRDMVSGGLSLPAALSKIAGGGSYQMPVLQAGTSQAAQVDYSGIGSAFERLSGIPSGVQQMKMQDAQLESLRQEMQLRQEAAFRQEEQHRFDMWQKLYGKDATLRIDALSSEIVQMAADKGISLDNIESIDQLRKAFDLDNNKIWREMPNMARTQVVDAVRSQAAENRAQQSAQDVHRSALDKHELDQQTLNDLRDHAEQWHKEQNARDKETAEREVTADLKKLTAQLGLAESEFYTTLRYYLDEKGVIHVKDAPLGASRLSNAARDIWDAVFSVIPIKSIGDNLLRGIINIGG